jgi:hypothetical protein
MHRRKLRDCLGVRLTASAVAAALDRLDNLERLTPREVGDLVALLA